ncbi:MAG: hypothetical protein HZC10_06615 [Nitrospirae bacterium]|nr:hypothetical protein [Nitrospirota bacterium]
MIKEEIRESLLHALGQTNFSINGEDYSLYSAVESLSKLEQKERGEVLKHGNLLAKTDTGLAFHFFLTAPELLKEIEISQLPFWVNKRIEHYDKGTKDAGSRILFNSGLEFKKVEGILKLYEHALGNGLVVCEGEETYTDTLNIFLPSSINISDDDNLNLKAYKAIIAHKYGQVKYGTFRFSLDEIKKDLQRLKKRYDSDIKKGLSDFENFFNLFPDRELALDIFMMLENLRVERILSREFKGLARDMELFKRNALKEQEDINSLPPKRRAIEGLFRCLMDYNNNLNLIVNISVLDEILPIAKEAVCAMNSSSTDSASATIKIYEIIDNNISGSYIKLNPFFYYGTIKIEKITEAQEFINKTVKEVIKEVKEENEKKAKSNFLNEQDDKLKLKNIGWDIQGEKEFTEEMRAFEKAGQRFKARFQGPATDANIDAVIEKGPNVFIYDEWDVKRWRYRKEWCAVRESIVQEGNKKIVEDIQTKHAHLISSIRKQFEAMRDETKRLRKQRFGDEIDIDAVIEMVVDIKAGSAPSDDLYINTQKDRRDIATALLVDISGSTNGWVIDTEKAAMVLFSEALNGIKDKYAIYAFSSRTRANCSFYVVKDFDEKYNDAVKKRIAGLNSGDYTRMGAPIRHLTQILEKIEARKKLMITLSDGKPEDYDEYKGEYGIEDTRMALTEAKAKGITPFCITIDKEGENYLPRMYGEANYTIIDEIEKLPSRLPQIYKKLTA